MKHRQLIECFKTHAGFSLWVATLLGCLFMIFLKDHLTRNASEGTERILLFLGLGLTYIVLDSLYRLVNPKRRQRFFSIGEDVGYIGRMKKKYGESHEAVQITKKTEQNSFYSRTKTRYLLYSMPIISFIVAIYIWTK